MTNYDTLIVRLEHLYADGDPITEEAASAIRELSGISEQLRQQRDALLTAAKMIFKDGPVDTAFVALSQAIRKCEGETK